MSEIFQLAPFSNEILLQKQSHPHTGNLVYGCIRIKKLLSI